MSAPITLTGNSLSLLGDATSSAARTSATTTTGDATAGNLTTSGEDAAVAGNQIPINAVAPVTATGNSISLLGDARTENAATVVNTGGASPPGDAWTTTGEDSLAGGNQVPLNAVAPVTASGNAVSLLGDATTTRAATTTSTNGSGSSSAATTTGEDSILGGNQLPVGVVAPVTAAGNSISILGDARTENATTTVTSNSGSSVPGTAATTTGEDGLGSGNQVPVAAVTPVTVAGNAISVLDDAWTGNSSTEVMTGGEGSGALTTSGEDSILGGNQLPLGVGTPVTLSNNAVSVLDEATSENGSTTVVVPNTGSDLTTSGEDGIGSGNQLPLNLFTPITIGGNAVSVTEEATTTTPGTNVPGTPTEPGTPEGPVLPSDPGTPGTGNEVVPTTPGTSAPIPTGSGVAVPVTTSETGITTAQGDTSTRMSAAALPTTGFDGLAVLAGLATLLMLAGGFVLLFMRRRAHMM